MPDELLGRVTHYFNNIGVAVIRINKGKLSLGETIHFKHGDRDFEQVIDSMQIDKEQVESVKKGQEVALKVDNVVREGDDVFKVV